MGREALPSLSAAPWRLGGALGRLLCANPLYRLSLAGGVPAEVRPLPPTPWPGDLGAARAIVAGERLSGEAPWAEADAADHGFAWLADLGSLGSPEARARGRALLGAWIAAHPGWSLPAWRPDVLGRRLANWLAGAAFLEAGAEAPLAADFRRSLAAQTRHLGRVAAFAGADADAFAAVAGLILAGIAMPGHGGGAGLGLLARQVQRQVLPDGGHVQRNPALHLAVLRHLIEVRAALAAAHAQVPGAVHGAIDRMTPMLRGLRLGDGGLALFHGGGEGDSALIDAVLAQAGIKGKAVGSAPHAGFQRLAAGRTIVIVDSGAPPAGGHAGSLGFEMSSERQRIVVNCGAYPGEDAAWQALMRSTAAHSTLVVDDAGSAEVVAGGVRRGPAEVSARRRQADGDTWLETSHDGYRRRFGLVHKRRLYLAASGQDLRGEDRLVGAGGRAFAVRFHLHPLVRASLNQARTQVLLKPPTGRGWRLQAAGGSLDLEDSVYFGAGVRQRTSQIVVSGALSGDGALVKWRLSRVEA